jgi:hypothetical protein
MKSCSTMDVKSGDLYLRERANSTRFVDEWLSFSRSDILIIELLS